MDEASIASYLVLRHSDYLSPHHFGRLMASHGLIASVLSDPQYAHLSEKIEKPSDACKRAIDEELDWASRDEHSLICFESPHYPPLLKEIDCPPPVLAVEGSASLLETQVAMVGSRKCSNYGERCARWMALELAEMGVTITSGLALGIDTAAHHGALAARQDRTVFSGLSLSQDRSAATIAVVATGLDKVYPARNISLAKEIAEAGAIVSEFPLGSNPLPANFPRRNRIISGLSHGVIVVEASMKSGSLITARLASEQNRDVFAVPGPINTANSEGSHWLITKGASLVTCAADVMRELNEETIATLVSEARSLRGEDSAATTESKNVLSEELRTDNDRAAVTQAATKANRAGPNRSIKRMPTQVSDPLCRRLLQLINKEPILFDELRERSGLATDTLSARLLQLEILGAIEMKAGRIHSLG